MTIQEIIESIDYCLECDNDRIPTTQEDLKIIKEALEKQIPKKPLTRNVVNYKRFFCPNCKKFIITKVNDDSNEVFIELNGSITKEVPKYCDNCGQQIYDITSVY